MKTNIIFSIILVCLANALTSQSTIEGSITSGGLERTYRLYIPEVYNGSESVPLVLNLHGYGSNNLEQEYYGDFRPIADTANFIIVHPNGTPDGLTNFFWNSFDASAINDVAFLSSLIDTIAEEYNIDPTRIYSTGMSNGGYMSYDLACSLSHRIAAIASVTGSMTPAHMASCAPQHPLPVMEIHGTADGTVPYEGNFIAVATESLVAHWVEFNNCNPVPVITDVPDINSTDNCTAQHYVYSGGDAGSTVEFYKIIGGDHSWPGAPVNINVTNMDFSASKEIWRFFSQYKLDELTGLVEQSVKKAAPWNIFPNASRNGFRIAFDDPSFHSVSVYNTKGQLLQLKESSGNSVEIKLDAAGIYLVSVTQAGSSQSVKWVGE